MISTLVRAGRGFGRGRSPVWFLLLALCVTPAALSAQAICAAPHSAPSLRPSGSIETIVPLTEGQVDRELALETGYYVAGDFPLQMIASAGYRWRELNDQVGRKPGDERFLYLGVGGPQRGWRWGLAFEGLWGLTPEDNGLALPGARRKLLQLAPSVAFQFGRSEVELGARIPLSGRNLANGNAFTLGFYLPWALP